MNIAVLLITRKVVRLKGVNYEILNPLYTLNGILYSFHIKDVEYSLSNSFIINGVQVIGYCNSTILKEYINKEISEVSFLDKKNWFDDSFAPAQLGDIFEINKVDFRNSFNEYDFEYYFRKIHYKFKIKHLGLAYFLRTQNFPEQINTNIDSPDYNERIITESNLNNTISGKFYKKNFGDKVNSLSNLTNEEKEDIALAMVYVCHRIHWILEENLLEIVSILDSNMLYFFIYEKYVTYTNDPNSNGQYDDLTIVDKLVGEIFKDWGVYNDNSSTFAPKDVFPVLDLNLINKYQSSLANFYNSLHLVDEEKLFKYDSNNNPVNEFGTPLIITNNQFLRDEIDSDRRLIKLLSLLPNVSFTFFSPAERLKLLDKALLYGEIYEERSDIRSNWEIFVDIATSNYESFIINQDDTSIFIESDIINLVKSFDNTYEEANLLLDFLLETKNFDEGISITKYERLYNLINDKGADNIAVVNWFVSEENNRGRLILALYEIWQKSKYYFYSQPPGVPLTENKTNPENFFLFTTEGQSYYANYDNDGNVIPNTGSEPILEFASIDTGLGLGLKFTVRYIPNKKIKKEKIIVNREIKLENFASDYIPDIIENNTLADNFYGEYHLYQSISLVGYKVDEDIASQAPKISFGLIPAFLFHYVEEYDRLKNLYAGISFVIEFTLEVGLFFATAGSSAALSLRHLRHLTKLGRIANISGTLESGVLASDILLSWRVAEGAAEIVSMTAGVASSYLSFLGTVNDDASKRRLSYFFAAFAFASAGGAIYSNRKVIKLADDIIAKSPTTLITELQNNYTEVYNLILQVKGKKVAALTDFGTILNDLPIVKNYYDNVLVGPLADLKPKFFEDFGALGPAVLSKLDNTQVLNNWKKLAELNAVERKLFDIISNSDRTITLEKFYVNSPLRTKIEILDINKKISFIDNFKDITTIDFNKFLGNPDLVTDWFRYFDENLLKSDFTNLIKSKQLIFLEEYGQITSALFDKLKLNSGIIKSWNKYSDQADLMIELNKYTKEEQILFFNLFKSNDLVNFNKFMVDPLLLVIQRNYLKAYKSLKVANYQFSTTLSEVFANHGTHGEGLFTSVEQAWQVTKNSGLNDKQLKEIVLKSGFSHQDYPNIIAIRDNISKKLMDEFLQKPKDINGIPLNEVWKRNPDFVNNVIDINKIKAIYANFETGQYKIIHPWLEKRISYHIEQRLNDGWKIDVESIGRTGHVPGTHAEIRALNELLWRLQQNGLTISDDVLSKILGYNKNYSSTGIMPRCGDCFFLSKEIKMIMSN